MITRAQITSVGARTSLGLNALQTGFLYRTGMAALRESALLDAAEGRVTFCHLETLDPYLSGSTRAWALAQPAIDECLAPHRDILQKLRLEVLTFVDEFVGERNVDGSCDAEDIGAMVQRHVRRSIHESVITRTSTSGPAGPALLLPEAIERLRTGQSDALLWGGIHTDYSPRRIAALEHLKRLYHPEQLDALVPGDGSAWVLCIAPGRARQYGMRVFGEIIACGEGHDKARPDNDESAYEAAGLTLAVRRVLNDLNQQPFGWWLSDISYEAFRVQEWQSVLTRLSDAFTEPQQLDAPPQRLGYLGGATLPLCCVLAAEAWRRGWAPHDRALCTAGSDSGARGALALQAPR